MTTFEFTNYFFDTLASEFEQAWDGLYRLVCEPSFGTQEVELERKIILSEVAGMKSSPLAIAYHVAMKEFLPNTSLAMPIPGTRRSLNRISFQQIREFYDAHYVPNNMFVVIVGGVKTESALEAVRRTFAERDSADLPPKQFTLPPRQKRVKRGMTDFIASVADMAPAGGAALSDIGCWGVAVGTAPKDLGEAEQIVENEMRRLTTEPLPSEELETARSRVLGRFVIACETNSGRAGFYTVTELAGEFLSLDENRRRIEAVTPESIAAAAKHKFQDKEVMLLDVKPARGIGKVLAIMRYLFFVRI
jgi:predicted Zn-dependent peptidase